MRQQVGRGGNCPGCLRGDTAGSRRVYTYGGMKAEPMNKSGEGGRFLGRARRLFAIPRNRRGEEEGEAISSRDRSTCDEGFPVRDLSTSAQERIANSACKASWSAGSTRMKQTSSRFAQSSSSPGHVCKRGPRDEDDSLYIYLSYTESIFLPRPVEMHDAAEKWRERENEPLALS